jgi:hypothetical protein
MDSSTVASARKADLLGLGHRLAAELRRLSTMRREHGRGWSVELRRAIEAHEASGLALMVAARREVLRT